jgi:RNA polymerase sigma-70 factor (ECF subfamily)
MGGLDLTDVPDEELARRAQRNPNAPAGRHAVAELLTRYTHRIYGICFDYTGEREAALDLSQDILLSAYEKLNSFKARGRFAAWIYAVARNRCRNALRSRGASVDDSVDPQNLGDQNPDPVEDLILKSDEEALLSLIHTHLSQEEQTVLWLRCVEKIPHSTLNEIVGDSTASGSRGILQRARRKLRSALNSKRAR